MDYDEGNKANCDLTTRDDRKKQAKEEEKIFVPFRFTMQAPLTITTTTTITTRTKAKRRTSTKRKQKSKRFSQNCHSI